MILKRVINSIILKSDERVIVEELEDVDEECGMDEAEVLQTQRELDAKVKSLSPKTVDHEKLIQLIQLFSP